MAAAAVDCAFLGVVTAASLMPYVGHLGFYYDDYSVLTRMSFSEDRSLLGLYDSVRSATGQRPLQALTFATLYWFFGADALGYHIWNAVLLVAIAALLYLVLRELRLPRLVCVAVPLLYSTLPHYATNRFWVDAFQINVSIACYLLSLYAGLRAVRASLPALIAWLPIAVLVVVGSLLAYEVVLPLFALNLGLIWWTVRRLESEVNRRAAPTVVGALAAAILAAGFTKLALVAEQGQNVYRIGFQDGFPHHVAYLISGSIKLHLGTYFRFHTSFGGSSGIISPLQTQLLRESRDCFRWRTCGISADASATFSTRAVPRGCWSWWAFSQSFSVTLSS